MNQNLDNKVANLLDIIQHTELVATKIHGVFDKEEIFRIVEKELKKSKQYQSLLLLLSDEEKAFYVKFVTTPSGIVKMIEEAIKTGIKGFKLDYDKTTILHRAIEKEDTYFFKTIELIKQVLPNPIGFFVAKITGHIKKITTVTPIKIGNKVIGIFAIDSPDSLELIDYFTLSVKNLAQHISVALELAEENDRRKKFEDALKRSELKFRTLYESTDDAVILSDNKGFFECNAATLKIFGCSMEELKSKHDAEFSPLLQPCGTNSLTLAYQKREEALTKGNIHFEWIHKRIDNGETFPAEISLKTIELDGYQIHQTVVRDITERKKSEEALLRSEMKFRTLYDSTTDAVMLLNDKGFFDCNTATLKLFGCATKEEFYVKHPADLSPPEQPCGTDSMTLANKQIALAMEKGSNKFDWIHKKVDTGELFPADVLLNRMELDGNQVLQATVRDITKRKKAEEKLTRISDTQSVLNDVLLLTLQEQTINEILGKVLDIILSVKWLALDAKGSVFLVEEKSNELVLIMSRNLHDSLLSTCAIVPFGRCLCGRAAQNRDVIFSPCLDETHENTYNGIKPHGHYCVPIIHEEAVLGVINVYVEHNHLRKEEDVKFLKAFAALVAKIIIHYRTKEEIKALADNLIEKNKDLEQFAYIISHDLQEPLRTINSFIDLIGKEFSDKMDEDFKQYFKFIEQATNRMRTLIKNILDYSRLGKNNKLVRIDCNTLLNEVVIDLNAIIKESHATIKFENLPVINAFPIELKQLFQNLIANAIKFRKKDIPPEIKVTAKKENGDWLFAVQDNGIGINKKYQEKIFQIFQRLHNRDEYEGTGIGLAFCKKIAEMHDGKIWVESKESEGSIFYFNISSS